MLASCSSGLLQKLRRSRMNSRVTRVTLWYVCGIVAMHVDLQIVALSVAMISLFEYTRRDP